MEKTAADNNNTHDAEIYARARELLAKKNFDKAIEALDESLGEYAENAVALALAGDIYAAGGDIPQAVGHYALAIQAAPEEVEYKRQFIKIAGSIPFSQHNPVIEEILCLCLATPEIECAQAQVLWYTLVRFNPQFQPLLKPILENPALALINNPFEKAANLSFLLQPIFLMGVKRIVTCNEEFEYFMTVLRQFLLAQAIAPQRKLTLVQYQTLIDAVAQYCFNTEYIFNRTETEEKTVEALRNELENNPAARQDLVKTGLYACYEPFYKLKAAQDMAYLPSLKAQLAEYLDLQARAAKMPSLTEITNATSLKVQEQYEEFPYPRWLELVLPKNIDNHILGQAGPQILVAGCGTGQEPLIFAKTHPLVSILGIDLSRASLAYASKKAEDLGIKNIEFRHADILQLGSLNRTFDGISSMGVLHHMKEPLEGWKILTKLLKTGGIMQIGLYSALARRSVGAVWEAIRKGPYPDTAAGMRRFRKDSKELLGDKLHDKLFDSRDYYHLSMYRDLLFHVQEHQFTLPQIKNILDDLKLEFLEMAVSEDIRDRYRQQFPSDMEGKNLDNWHKMEEENPDMFTGMYKFHCRKKA